MLFNYVDIFYTEKYIDFKLKKFDGSLSEDDQKILDRLCKKIDVAKTIKKEYMPFLTRPLTSESIDGSYQKKILQLFLMIIKYKCDYKLLNSAFKLIDLMIIDEDVIIIKLDYEEISNRLVT